MAGAAPGASWAGLRWRLGLGRSVGLPLPGEAVADCARRELLEETGLDLSPAPLLDVVEWPLFLVEVPTGTDVRLSREHDTGRWVDLLTACELIKPEPVTEQLRRAARLLQAPPSDLGKQTGRV